MKLNLSRIALFKFLPTAYNSMPHKRPNNYHTNIKGGVQLRFENQKQSIATQIWLNYYNSYLYHGGIITETERNKIKNLINASYRSSAKRQAHNFT